MSQIFQKVDLNNIDLLKSFVNGLGVETDTFRYYKSRDISVIKNHVLTMLLLIDGEPVGYGHLDKDGDIVWLGVVVKKSFQGRGLGPQIIGELIKQARKMKIPEISLTVDSDNQIAIGLYERHGFRFRSENKAHKLYSLTL